MDFRAVESLQSKSEFPFQKTFESGRWDETVSAKFFKKSGAKFALWRLFELTEETPPDRWRYIGQTLPLLTQGGTKMFTTKCRKPCEPGGDHMPVIEQIAWHIFNLKSVDGAY